MLTNLFLGQTAEEKNFIEDLFSCYLYTGNGSTQAITNGIDLAGKGGMVWVKNRGSAANHFLMDTNRGIYGYLSSNTTAADPGTGEIQSYNSNGFSLVTSSNTNASNNTYASWTFRKAPKFFDVVTWTGNATARDISHSLGVSPGLIIIKRTDAVAQWPVWHRSLPANNTLFLNTTDNTQTASGYVTSVSANTFSIGTSGNVNATGGSYVAYLFAHDTTADGVIQCGSFTTDASGNATVNLGWEPQFILWKNTSTAGSSWQMADNMRGLSLTDTNRLLPNANNAELSGSLIAPPNSSGFTITGTSASVNWVYLAIRRGPMRVPTDATKVFSPDIGSSTGIFDSNFPVDLFLRTRRSDGINITSSRLQGDGTYIRTYSTAAEATGGGDKFDSNTSLYFSGGADLTGWIAWLFRRAPGFFDITCYSGTGVARTVSHNLGVAPELIIIKSRSAARSWCVGFRNSSNGRYDTTLRLNLTNGELSQEDPWFGSAAGSATYFPLGTDLDTNGSGITYVAYLFATCAGVSKVFSFTGNGSSQNIDCGFTNGARFVLIKRTDSTGNWLVGDTARGIISANDPSLALNSTAAEVTTADWLDPLSTGFTVVQETTNNANVNGATYIGLAIA